MTDDAAQGFTEAMLRTQGRGALLVLSTDDANCEFRVYSAAGPGESEALAVAAIRGRLGDEDIRDVDRPRSVMLPSGPAFHMSWTIDTGNPELSMYLGQQDDLAYRDQVLGPVSPRGRLAQRGRELRMAARCRID